MSDTRALRSLGQVAYEAYGDHQGWRSVHNEGLPAWPNQTPEQRSAWESAAHAVRTALQARESRFQAHLASLRRRPRQV